MSRIVRSTVLVADIPSIVSDPARGEVSLVGDHGGISLITGQQAASGLVMGTLSIETEHGVVYLDPDQQQEIQESFPDEPLDYDILVSINDMLTLWLAGQGVVPEGEDADEELNNAVHDIAHRLSHLVDATNEANARHQAEQEDDQ